MKNILIVLACLTVLAVVGYAFIQSQNKSQNTSLGKPDYASLDMDSIPCHQMPDGSWMGDC